MESIPSEGEVRSEVIRWEFACMFETLCEIQRKYKGKRRKLDHNSMHKSWEGCRWEVGSQY